MTRSSRSDQVSVSSRAASRAGQLHRSAGRLPAWRGAPTRSRESQDLRNGQGDDPRRVGSSSPLCRNFFTAGFRPDADRSVQDRFDEMQRVSLSAENALRLQRDRRDRYCRPSCDAGSSASRRGRPHRTAGGGAPDRANPAERPLCRTARQQPHGAGRHASLRPVLRTGRTLHLRTRPSQAVSSDSFRAISSAWWHATRVSPIRRSSGRSIRQRSVA